MGVRRLVVAALVCLASATASVTVLAQTAPEFADPYAGFGLGGAGSVGMFAPSDVWLFDVTPLGLGDIDPLTGAIMGNAEIPDSFDHAATATLMETNQLAFDAAKLAADARARAEAKRAAAVKAGFVVRSDARNYGYPEPWELDNFSSCGKASNARYQARTEVVMLWEIMCQAAAADGVNLGIVSAYRSIEHQERLWKQKLAETGGDEAAAAKWVARPGRSNHNRGTAIDTNTSTDPAVKNWFHAPVGCYAPPDQLRVGSGGCSSNESVVKRLQLYGFVAPMSWEPWHIEPGIPIMSTPTSTGVKGDGNCHPATSMSVPEMIGAIWRCRLADAGITGGEQVKVVAEALVVAKCESGWKATAFIHGGKYANTPNPADGKLYTARGVFQFIRVSGDNWIEGGWANADDPRANIDAAARYYVYERRQGREGWGPWACRTVLPQYGGAALPAWAYEY